MKSDRRSGADRRRSLRHQMLLELEFESPDVRHSGTLSDISREGCFIMSGALTHDGDPIRIYIPLGTGMSVEYLGEVANQVLEIGFAVRFGHLTAAQIDFLDTLFGSHKEKSSGSV